MPNNIHPYDTSYKQLFANQEVVASLLQGFIPADILADMDLSTLEPLPSEHITKDNKERRNDLLWKVRYGDSFCYLIIMLEFQSAEDWWMAIRVMEYSALVLRDAIKYAKLNKKDKLPLIFPFVLYNGDKKWQAPEEISQLFFEHDKNIDIYQPHQKYYLLDIKHLSDSNKNMDNNLSMQIFNFENAPSIENIINALANLAKILPEHEKSHIHEAFINLLSVNIIDDPNLSEQLIPCKSLQEAYNMLAQHTPRWKLNLINEGIEKGIEKGREEGREEGILIGEIKGVKDTLQDILKNRFGILSEEILKTVDKISNAEILKKLVLEAVSADSLAKFIEKLHARHD